MTIAAPDLDTSSAQEVLAYAVEKFHPRLTMATNYAGNMEGDPGVPAMVDAFNKGLLQSATASQVYQSMLKSATQLGHELSFRVIEIATMAAAAVFSTFVIWDGRSRRWEGFLLVGVYGLAVVAYALA